MRTLIHFFAAGLLAMMGFCTVAQAATDKAAATAAPTTESSTSHNFEDLLVQGKYHFSDEAVTTVEEDKVLDSLIGVRADFKDRLKESADRY